MPDYRPWLKTIPEHTVALIPRFKEWCSLSTPTLNSHSIRGFVKTLHSEFSPYITTSEIVELKPWETLNSHGQWVQNHLGPALRCIKNPQASKRIFLGIHTDVVYGDLAKDLIPQREIDGHFFSAGAADAKGGIAVMLLALQAFSNCPWNQNLGFEILLNPDEEIGSPGSIPLLQEAATRNHLGILFEPALSDGSLVSRRKGSGNFTAMLRGKGGHAGRDAATGRNALHGLAELIVGLNAFISKQPGSTVNVGRIEGGGAVNRIPDLGLARFNIRVEHFDQMEAVRLYLREQIGIWSQRDGYALEIHGDFASPPKNISGLSEKLLHETIQCGQELGLELKFSPSGGVCDGNKLAAFGLPNLDTLGPVGGNLHGGDEWIQIESLHERAELVALLLMKIASGESDLLQ